MSGKSFGGGIWRGLIAGREFLNDGKDFYNEHFNGGGISEKAIYGRIFLNTERFKNKRGKSGYD